MFDFYRCLLLAFGLLIAGSDSVDGQHPVAMEPRLPFEVTLSERGLEVSSYDGGDALLQPGDVITWVATPDSDETGVEVTSAEEFTVQVREKLDREGRIAVWVTRGNKEPVWIVVPVSSKAVSSRAFEQTVTVKAVDGGVEIVSYSGTDGLLQPGDLISWVSTPGSDDAGAEVTDPAAFQTELRARQDGDGNVALFMQRPGSEPEWIIVPLTSKQSPGPEVSLPLKVRSAQGGLEVVTYDGGDDLLQPGDRISLIMSPDSEQAPTEAASPEEFENIVRAMLHQSGRVAFWVERNGDSNWIVPPLASSSISSPPQPLSLIVHETGESLEVVEYLGADGSFQAGDLIQWVATPGGDDNGAEVKTLAAFQSEILAKQDEQGQVAIWMQRGEDEADWIVISMESLSSGTVEDQQREMDAASSSSADDGVASRGSEGSEGSENRKWGLPFDVYLDDEGLKVTNSGIEALKQGDLIQYVWDPIKQTKGELVQSASDLEWLANTHKSSDNRVSIRRARAGYADDCLGWVSVLLDSKHKFPQSFREDFRSYSTDTTIGYHINNTAGSIHTRLIPDQWGQSESLVTVAENDPGIKDFWKQEEYEPKFFYAERSGIAEKLKLFYWSLTPVSGSSNVYKIEYYENGGSSRGYGYRLLCDQSGTCLTQKFKPGAEGDRRDVLWCVTPSDNDKRRFCVRNMQTGAFLSCISGAVSLQKTPTSYSEIEWQIGDPLLRQAANTSRQIARPEINSGDIYYLGEDFNALTTMYHPQVGLGHAYDERAQWIFLSVEDNPDYCYIINLDSGMALTEETLSNWGHGSIVDRPRFTGTGAAHSILPFSVEYGRPDEPLKVVKSADKRFQPGDIILYVREPETEYQDGGVPGAQHKKTRPAGKQSARLTTASQLEEEVLVGHGWEDYGKTATIDVYVERGGQPVPPNGWIKLVLRVPDSLDPHRQQWNVRGGLRNRATGNELSAWANKCANRALEGLGIIHSTRYRWGSPKKIGSADDVAVIRIDELVCQRTSVGMDDNTKFLFKALDFVAEKAILPSSGPGFGTIMKRSFSAFKGGAGTGIKAGARELAKQSRAIITREFLIRQAKIYAVKKSVKENILHARNKAQGNKSRMDDFPPEEWLAKLALPDVITPNSDEVRTDDSITETLFSAVGGKDTPDEIYLKVNGVGVWPFKETRPLSGKEVDAFGDIFTNSFWEDVGKILIGKDKAGFYQIVKKGQTVPLNIEFVFRKSKGASLELMEWDVGKKSWDITPGLFGSDHDSLGVIEIQTMDVVTTEKIRNAIMDSPAEGSIYEMSFSASPLRNGVDQHAGKKPGEQRDDGFCWCVPGVYAIGSPSDAYPDKIDQTALQVHRMSWPPHYVEQNQFNPYLTRAKQHADDQITLLLTRGFWLSKNEVTLQQYFDVTGRFPEASTWNVLNPDRPVAAKPAPPRGFFPGFSPPQSNDAPAYPAGTGAAVLKDDPALAQSSAEQLSLSEMKLYCNKLNEAAAAGGTLPPGWRFVLPSEARWTFPEFAGTKTPYRFSDRYELRGDYAWIRPDVAAGQQVSEQTTRSRKKYSPNAEFLGFRVAIVRDE